jgi:hypothetical protein
MSLELIPLCDAQVELATPIIVGAGPSGLRLIIEVATMTYSGERLNGSMKGSAGADWVTIVDGMGTIDVRTTIETTDGAVIFCQYRGRLDFSNGPGTAPAYVAPTFETGDERYKWLNLVQAAGVGTMNESATEIHYQWFELRSSSSD